ncbi:TolC family protein [Chitinivorax sp. B]|uniref:TolC family protein n=1 Tax=Chitinivorax sp. B TaxID=2502235 RepID=UPI0010F6A16A|nr:TolC family protein [Chitinivorax sp. B]
MKTTSVGAVNLVPDCNEITKRRAARRSGIRSRPRLTVLSAALASVLATGCAVAPSPIEKSERQALLAAERQAMFTQQEVLTGSISLQESMARALKYNLDYRVKVMEEALAQEQLDLANFDMLPKLALGAGYSHRNNDAASSSQDIATGRQSLVPSISTERDRVNADLTVSWNVLDFGVSYFTAKQQADKLLILRERKRKVAHQLMQQTRQAYWQAVGAQRLEPKIANLLKDAETALGDARRVEQEKLRTPLESLTYQRQLLDVINQMTQIRTTLSQAKPRLAAIMNLPPGNTISVAEPPKLAAPQLRLPVEQMEEMALTNRPELMEARYNERIGVLETRKAVAKLFPGLEFNAGRHYDNNKFLVNHNWFDAGLRVSWNLMNLFNAGNIRRTADAQLKVAQEQRMALNMAVLMQVHVAWLDYQGRSRQFELERDIHGVEQRLLSHSMNAAQTSAQGKLQAILAGANAVLAELRLYQGYGDLQNAYGQLAATIGMDALPQEVGGHDIASLSEALQGVAEQADTLLAGGAE